MNIRALFSLFLILFSIPLLHSVSAAGTIPRDWLRLELLLATGAQDTSGNNRPVTATGIAPTYQVDPVYGIPYAQFSGSGWLRVNTAWTAGASDDFTVSFWMRHSWIFQQETTLTGMMDRIRIAQPYSTPSDFRNEIYYTTLAQDIFVTADSGWMKLIVDKNWKCSFKGGYWTTLLQSLYAGAEHDWWKWTTVYQNEYRIVESWNNMQDSFSCPNILNNKWHNIIMKRKQWTFSIYIDGIEVMKTLNNAVSLNRVIDIWYTSTDIGAYSWKFTPSQINTLVNSKYLNSWIAWFRIYSKSLTDDEIEALGDEYRYAQSDLVGAGNITLAMEKYAKPNLTIQLKSIAPNLSKDTVEYQYSTDGKKFSGITDIIDISSSTGFLNYRVNLNLSSVPDGKVSITLRIKSGDTYQNIGTISFNKLDATVGITINQPASDIATSKTISATTEAWNVLYMSQTRWTVCDSTITTWEDYSDLTFTTKNDNGIRICYKSVNSATNKTIYKLSASIQWIQSLDDQKVKGYTLFNNYIYWTKSYYQKSDDSTSMVLDLLNSAKQRTDSYGWQWQWTWYSTSSSNVITMTDINGDWLVDFLYHSTDPVRRAILINNGNYTFKTVYKCAIDIEMRWDTFNYIPTGNTIYYGDCADPTR